MNRYPRAPWGRFPLSELVVLAAGGLAVAGVASWGTSRGRWALAAALALACLAGLELAIREHFAGRRRRSALLASAGALPAATVVLLLHVALVAAVGCGVAVFAALAFWLHRAYPTRGR